MLLASSLFRKANLSRQQEERRVQVNVAPVLKSARQPTLFVVLISTKLESCWLMLGFGYADYRSLTCTSFQRAPIRAPVLLTPHQRSIV